MSILKTSTAAIALTVAGSMAFAESHVMENDAEQVEQSLENAGQNIENATENAVDGAAVELEEAEMELEEVGNDIEVTTENAVDDIGEMQNFDLTTNADLIRTRDIVGGQVWRMDALDDNSAWDNNETYAGAGEGWERIGSIEDIVLSKTGQMVGIVGEVGGFLGLGDKMVMMPVNNVRLTALDDGTFAYVTQMTEEEIEAAQDVDEGFWD